ncbi:udp-glycosyltransferase 91c1 [Quercus suber]|uniref:Udp-glycosyltransferase 91c1 n=1 Tax=Quercus suber TaxID=58331 RepID=A0AAW0KPQ8_QUESU
MACLKLPSRPPPSYQITKSKSHTSKKAYDMLEPHLTQFLQNSDVNWIIHDFVPHWLSRVATQLGVNSVFFSTVNASVLAFFGPPSEMTNVYRKSLEDFTVPELLSHRVCMDMNMSDLTRAAMVIQGFRFVILFHFQLGCYRPQCKDRVVNEEDNKSLKSLKEWVKNKKENSVVYIAFGTESTLNQENESRLVKWDRKIGVAFHLDGQEPPTY